MPIPRSEILKFLPYVAGLVGVIGLCGSSDSGGFVERTFSLVVGLRQFTDGVALDTVFVRSALSNPAGFGGRVVVFFDEVAVEILWWGRDAGSVVFAVGTVVGSFVFVHGSWVLMELA